MAGLALAAGAGCTWRLAASPRAASPGAPVALVTDGSAFQHPGMRERVAKAVQETTGRTVLLVDAAKGPSDSQRALAARLGRERRELTRYDWREPRCTTESAVLPALTTNADAVYRVSLDVAQRTRPLTAAETESATARPQGLRDVLRRSRHGTARTAREESVVGSVTLAVFAQDPSPARVRIERRVTRFEPGGGTPLDVPTIVAGALRELPPPVAPQWEAYARRLVAAGCPLLALSVSEARLGTGKTFRNVKAAALSAMRRSVERRAARARGRAPVVAEVPEAPTVEVAAPPAEERPSCSALCGMHMVELCNNDRALWIAHRARWDTTPCGTRRQEAFLEECYREQWQNGTFEDACVVPCERTAEGRERLESILRRAGCLHSRS